MKNLITDVVEKQTFGERFIFLPTKYQTRVNCLRDSAPPSDVQVFRANDDGSKGRYLRTEYH